MKVSISYQVSEWYLAYSWHSNRFPANVSGTIHPQSKGGKVDPGMTDWYPHTKTKGPIISLCNWSKHFNTQVNKPRNVMEIHEVNKRSIVNHTKGR